MPLSTDVIKKIVDKGLDVAGDAAKKLIEKRIAGQPAQVTQPAPPSQARSQVQARQSAATARLVKMKGESVKGQIALTGAGLVLGRQNLDADDQTLSHKHSQFFLRQGQFWVCDLKSRNGTYVNGQQISQRALQPGDRIQIGTTVLVFERD